MNWFINTSIIASMEINAKIHNVLEDSNTSGVN